MMKLQLCEWNYADDCDNPGELNVLRAMRLGEVVFIETSRRSAVVSRECDFTFRTEANEATHLEIPSQQ
jgi:hypothetical protein